MGTLTPGLNKMGTVKFVFDTATKVFVTQNPRLIEEFCPEANPGCNEMVIARVLLVDVPKVELVCTILEPVCALELRAAIWP